MLEEVKRNADRRCLKVQTRNIHFFRSKNYIVYFFNFRSNNSDSVTGLGFIGKSWWGSDEEVGQIQLHRQDWERMDLFNNW